MLGRNCAPDSAGTPKVVVVNEMFVRQYLPGRNPIGLIITEENGEDWQIVGVCRDTRYSVNIRREAEPMVLRRFDRVSFLLRVSFCELFCHRGP